MDPGDTNPSPRGVLGSLRGIGTTLLAVLHNRLELFALELQEERLRFLDMLLFAAGVVVLGFLTIAAAAAGILILVWNAFGVAGLFVASGVGLICTLIAGWWLRHRLMQWKVLSGTVAELQKDREWLKGKN
jgi:uncharacterized membrane protein YqjE